MHSTTRVTAGVVLCALSTAAVLASQIVPVRDDQRPARAAYHIKHRPLTIAASEVGLFAKGNQWYLSVNSAGEAELTIDTYPDKTRRLFDVPEKELDALRSMLLEMRFFDLDREYGQKVADSGKTTITIVVGDKAKTIDLYFIGNWIKERNKAKLRDPVRVLRVFLLIREWFDDPEAVDGRPALRRFLKGFSRFKNPVEAKN